MESLDASALPEGALLLVDSAPIIYTLEGHGKFAARFAPLFARHANGEIQLAVTTVTIAEVLTGPLKAGEEALARRYRAVMEAWHVVELGVDIAESAARLRGSYGLKLPDAIQLASALAINADALVTHDRDFANVSGLRVLA
ncbi:MAG: PIN domain-containing protein [Rhodanobacteraceae bacterium]|jgi:predicted nucleic acid-binding protein|nr:PIN domain-containing protein [Rhodanobacteraceae bacterium]MBL0041292.1 PIN domain-containing protein [Xanthomonadales bacterium]MBP6077496.1 PIN domain-containing protein [Xanthomonadales bacterium]